MKNPIYHNSAKMPKRYSYGLARPLLTFVGTLFVTQLVLELSGVIVRKPNFFWVTPALGVVLTLVCLYALTLLILNARHEYLKNGKQKP